MELSKFLSGRRKKDAGPSTPFAPPSPPPATESVTTNPASKEVETTLDDFAAIQSLLEQQSDTVVLPLSVLLRNLPVELQGPEWHDGPMPDGQILLDRETLSAQLKKGKLVYKLADLGGDLPMGWIRGGSDIEVSLDLRSVVESLPEDFFRLHGQISPDLIDAATMRDYFGPSAPGAPSPRIAPPVETAARADQREATSPACGPFTLSAGTRISSALQIEPGRPASLVAILESIVHFLSARSALVATAGGAILAQTREMKTSLPYAAAISWMQESRGPLGAIHGNALPILWMPAPHPPLLICASPSLVWVVESAAESPPREVLLRLQDVLRDLDALVSSRPVSPVSLKDGK